MILRARKNKAVSLAHGKNIMIFRFCFSRYDYFIRAISRGQQIRAVKIYDPASMVSQPFFLESG